MSHTDIVALPIPLILLVHLHILEYPLANNPEYDHQIFNPRTRGLRERAKIMEDVTYFLVGRIEGRRAKSILSTYPCVQPSESLAFRTSLSKYLETLRHQSIHSASARFGTKTGPNGNLAAVAEFSEASWWKDVVVRKSLLEECSGEKFERLIVALSTHALMKASGSISPEKMSSSLQIQPITYAASIAAYQAKRRAWTKTASLLTKSEHDLKILRESLSGGISGTTYSVVPTEKLQALADSKLHALLRRHWAGEEGERALSFLVLLAGIKSSRSPSITKNVEIHAPLKPSGPPSPLPVSAAHHPSHLKRLRRPIFQAKVKSDIGPVVKTSSMVHAEIMLAEHRETERRLRQNLVDAIARTNKIGSELKTKRNPTQSATLSKLFWSPPALSMASMFVDPMPGKELLISQGLTSEYEALDVEEDALEKKIEHIRIVVLPPYPTMPDQSAPRKPALDERQIGGKLKAPQTSRNQHARSIIDSASSSSSSLKLAKVDAPAPLLISPSKSSRSIRRKSVRFSMSQRRTQRVSSLFSDAVDDEVDRLVDETNDFPTDDENTDDEGYGFSPLKTPKSKARPTPNRIWTAGTPPMHGRRNGSSQATPRSRVPSALTRSLEMGPSVSLPSMPSTSSSAFGDIHNEPEFEDDEENAWNVDNVDATPRPVRLGLPQRADEPNGDVNEPDDEDVFGDDPPSMTLKEILLSADTSHFDLLEATSNEELDDGLVEDTSFVWE